MNRKESVIGGLDRILSAHQASALLGIPAEDLLPYVVASLFIDIMSLKSQAKTDLGTGLRKSSGRNAYANAPMGEIQEDSQLSQHSLG